MPGVKDVDVVLCTYDGASFLDAQLDSILRQTRAVDRVIVSDDGSTDDTLSIVRRYADRLPIELSVNATTLGVAANFQAALRRSRAELVFLCDQDDVWYSNKVATMIVAARENPQCWLFHSDARIVDDQGRPTGRTLSRSLRWPHARLSGTPEGGLLPLLRRNFVTGATVAVRRELLKLALPIPDGFWHDEWLALIAVAANRVYRIAEPLIDYRVHSANQAGLRNVQFAARLGAMASARGDQHAIRHRKIEALSERLRSLGANVRPERLRIVEACADHWRTRASLPGYGLARVRIVLRELLAGRYVAYSSGWRSAVRDLIEPMP
jgi:hypothetical protein